MVSAKKIEKENSTKTPHTSTAIVSRRGDRIALLLSELSELMQQQGAGKEAIHHLRQLQMRLRFASLRPQLEPDLVPTNAPAKWRERKVASESPADFIRREYGPWIGKGLTKAHIRKLDMSLYDALKHWLKKNKIPADLDLPTKQEMIDKKLAKGTRLKIDHTAEQREKLSLYKAARRRAAKSKPPVT